MPRDAKSERRARGTYRIVAVRTRRTGMLALFARARRRYVREPIADEEVIQLLWEKRACFESRLERELPVEDAQATLVDLRPGSVLAVVEFATESAEAVESAVGNAAAAVTIAAASVLASLGEVAVAAVPVEDSPPAAPAETTTPWGQVGPVLGAVATGIGVVGFVTFTGGVIVWARLQAAGFPAEPALSVMPTQDLLVIGAVTLVPQVLWGLLAVAVLFLGRVVFRLGRERMGGAEAALVEQQEPRLTVVAIGLAVAFALAGALVPSADDLEGWNQVVLFIVFALLLSALAAAIARVTSHFIFQATAIFLSLALFLGFLAYARARNANEARGAAVIRENKKAMVGFFVAEGAGRLYIARINLDDAEEVVTERSRLVGIQKDQVSDIAIGSPKAPRDAIEQGRALAAELCALQPRIDGESEPAERDAASTEASLPREICWTAPPGEPQGP